ncbi:MAG: amidohydrolase family protein [Pseudomonadota bacterium]
MSGRTGRGLAPAGACPHATGGAPLAVRPCAAMVALVLVQCAHAHHTPADGVAPDAPPITAAFFDLDWKERSAIWDVAKPRGKTRLIDFETDEGTWMSLDVSARDGSIVFDLLGSIYLLPSQGGRARPITRSAELVLFQVNEGNRPQPTSRTADLVHSYLKKRVQTGVIKQSSGISVNYHPRFSPAGDRIAFISDRAGQDNVWVMKTDGSHLRLVRDDLTARYAEPVWSPDGKYIYATRFLPNARGGWTKAAEIWRLAVDGSSAEKLLGSQSTQVWTPSPSSDGRYLYYHEASAPIVAADGYYKISDGHHIRRLDLQARRSDAITSGGYRWYYRRLPFYHGAPVVSPSGRYLAFVRELPNTEVEYKGATIKTQTGLFVRDLVSGEERLLVRPVTLAQFKAHSMYHIKFVPGFAWTPEEDAILFSEGGKIRKIELATNRLSTIPFKARVQREISEQNRPTVSIGDAPQTIKNIRSPALSPDGRVLAFEAIGKVWTKVLPDGEPRAVATPSLRSTQYSPSWSPDGSHLAFGTWSNEEAGAIWVVSIDDDGQAIGAPHCWSAVSGEYLNPTFSARGDSIIALRSAGSRWRGSAIGTQSYFDLVSIAESAAEPIELGVIRRLDLVSGQSPTPSVGIGGRIHITQRDGEDWNKAVLTSMSVDGGDARVEATFNALVAEGRVSPDGDWLAFQFGHNIHIARRPVSGAADVEFRPFEGRSERRQISRDHGRYPHWGADGVLHFISLDRYASCAAPFTQCEYADISLTARPDRAAGALALRNATLITSSQSGIVPKGDILIEDGRIRCVGRCADDRVDRSIDLSGKYVIPGLVSIHEHDTFDGPDVLRSRAPNVSKFLAYGVTTIMEPAPSSDTVLAQAELIRAGAGIGPRIFSTGRPIYGWAPERHVIRAYSDAVQNVRRLASKGAIGVKQYFEFKRHQRQWLADAARASGPTLLTGEMMDLHYFIGAIMDGHTTLEHENTYWPYFRDFREFIRQSGTQVSITSTTPARGRYLMEYFTSGEDVPGDPRQINFTPWEYLHRQGHDNVAPLAEYESMAYLQDLKQLTELGVVFGAGGHGEIPGLNQHWELWSFALHSSPAAAIEAVTIRSAEYLGLSTELGSIEPGKLGDLLVLNSDPLQDVRNSLDAAYVVKDGRVYEPETLDQIWPDQEAYGARPWVAPKSWSGSGRVGRPQAIEGAE